MKPTIFYFEGHRPYKGGVKQSYRHVDILNTHGNRAYVVHPRTPEVRWFENRTPTLTTFEFGKHYVPERDFVVIGEEDPSMLQYFGRRTVIFNQGLCFGFTVLGATSPDIYPWHDERVKAVLTVSDRAKALMELAKPTVPVIRVHNGVDETIFCHRPLAQKERVIALNPGKNPTHLATIAHLLMSRARQGLNDLRHGDFRLIENMTESGVASALNAARVYLFLSTDEGFGLSPLEAMLSGCLTFAYQLAPFTEFMPSECLVPFGDFEALVDKIESACRMEVSPEWVTVADKALVAARKWSLAHEAQSVISAWTQILAS